MLSRVLFRPVLCMGPGVVTLVLVACGGRGPLDTDIAAYDAPDAAGLTVIDPGEGTEPKAEAGAKPMDAGASKDAKAPTMPGIPGLSEDAGGILGCFACAQDKCGTQVNACASSPACVTEGTCGLGCVTGLAGGTAAGGLAGGTLAGGGLAGGGTAGGGGLNLQCLMACDTDMQANADLFAALECTFTSCSSECLGALGGAGGGLGGLGGTLGGLGGLGGGMAGGGLTGIGARGAAPAAE